MIGEDIYSQLSSYAGLTALVSARIYRQVMPQNVVYPSVSFHQIGESPIYNLKEESGLTDSRWQLSIWAKLPSTAANVAEQCKLAMAAASTYKSIRNFQIEQPYDFKEEIYHTTIDFAVWQ